MVLDRQENRDEAWKFSIFDAATGQCLDGEGIFYADDEAGYYLRHLRDESGDAWVWDARDKRRLTGTFADSRHPIPSECMEVAWERVDRAIAIRPKARAETPIIA